MSPILQMGHSPFGRCGGARSHQAIHSQLEKRERAQGASLPLQVSLGGVGPHLPSAQSPALPLAYPRYNPHTSLGGLHLEVDVDKKTDALARHNGGVDRVEGLFPQALIMGFRGIIRVTLEIAWRPNHHQERTPQEGLAISTTAQEGFQAQGVGILHCPT